MLTPAQNQIVVGHRGGQGLSQRSHRVIDYYLPAIYQEWHFPDNFRNVCERVAYCSDETEERHSIFPGLSVGHIISVYDFISKAAESRSINQNMDQAIFDFLAENCRDALPGMRPGSTMRAFGQALTWFRAVAEVSHQASSVPLGEILSRFFTRYADRLLYEYQPETAVVLAHAVYQSYMHPWDRNHCLQIIAAHEPGMTQWLRQQPDRYLQLLGVDIERGDDSYGGYQYEKYGHRRLSNAVGLRHRSRSPSPIGRRQWTRAGDRYNHRRASSAPGYHRIARQADKVMEAAEDMIDQAERLKRICYV